MSQLYSETFLEYAKNPPNKGALEHATIEYFEENRKVGGLHLKSSQKETVPKRDET